MEDALVCSAEAALGRKEEAQALVPLACAVHFGKLPGPPARVLVPSAYFSLPSAYFPLPVPSAYFPLQSGRVLVPSGYYPVSSG